MEEQILIKSERANIKKGAIISATILSVLVLIAPTIICIIQAPDIENIKKYYDGMIDFISKYYPTLWFVYVIVSIIDITIWAIAVIYVNAFSKTELFVTNSRVYGITLFNKRIDLPIDAITAVGTGIFNTISISTASGVIKFSYLKNRDNIHQCINALVISRQQIENNRTTTQATIRQEIPFSNADELKKYKELLDMGVITQEEFNTKKNQLLK